MTNQTASGDSKTIFNDLFENPDELLLLSAIISTPFFLSLFFLPSTYFDVVGFLVIFPNILSIVWILIRIYLYIIKDNEIAPEHISHIIQLVIPIASVIFVLFTYMNYLQGTLSAALFSQNLPSIIPSASICMTLTMLNIYNLAILLRMFLSHILRKSFDLSKTNLQLKAIFNLLFGLKYFATLLVVSFLVLLVEMQSSVTTHLVKSLVFLTSNYSKNQLINEYDPQYTWSFTKYDGTFFVLQNFTGKAVTLDNYLIKYTNEFTNLLAINGINKSVFLSQVKTSPFKQCIYISQDKAQIKYIVNCVLMKSIFDPVRDGQSTSFSLIELIEKRNLPPVMHNFIQNKVNLSLTNN